MREFDPFLAVEYVMSQKPLPAGWDITLKERNTLLTNEYLIIIDTRWKDYARTGLFSTAMTF